ncbi:MAG: thiamine diphosphokinase [Gammaproteobacteria bacterium]|nr:thiamine diphosphokinase [Gammaproteobacteria bacterium]
MNTIIIGGGTPPSAKLLAKEIKNAKTIICADGGANCLLKQNFEPHHLIGDFDSITDTALKNFSKKSHIIIEKHPKDKAETDILLALKKAVALGATNIVFLGCTGGKRIDHAVGNLGILAQCLALNVNASLKDDFGSTRLIDRPTVISAKKGKLFSIQAYCDVVKNLSVTGSKFTLNSYDLNLGDTLTLSNEFLSTPVNINFTSGRLLLFIED